MLDPLPHLYKIIAIWRLQDLFTKMRLALELLKKASTNTLTKSTAI
jgi:hypothetical protein